MQKIYLLFRIRCNSMSKQGRFLFILIALFVFSSSSFVCEASAKDPNVKITTLVRSVEKVDLVESTFRIDFYLMIEADLRDIWVGEVQQFEFANGEPTIRVIQEDINEWNAGLAYRVRGDFVSQFDLGNYPFDSHNIEVVLDFMFANNDIIIETESIPNPEMIIVGWDLEGIETRHSIHSYAEEDETSRFIISIKIRRPLLSTILKNVVPISVISAIALLTFLISANNPSQRIGIGVSTLLSATAFHLSLLGGIPPTGEFTIADGIMLSVYLIHFYSLLISVYLMRLKEREDPVRAEEINKKAIILLPLIIVLPIAIAILINL